MHSLTIHRCIKHVLMAM